VLAETETAETEFGTITKPAYLVLELVDGYYVARRFSQIDGGEFVETARVVPSDTLGRPLPRIPFTFINANDLNADVSPSPLAPLADVDVAWMRSSADYEAATRAIWSSAPRWKTGRTLSTRVGRRRLCLSYRRPR
jgi:hypothetical protein